jgi:hypothetical protein
VLARVTDDALGGHGSHGDDTVLVFAGERPQVPGGSLGVASENTAAAESLVRDADFASETAELTRAQILTSSATQILTIANSQPQSALQLLG